MVVIGIDPGARGAIATIEAGQLLSVVDMPTDEVRSGRKTKTRVNAARLAAIVDAIAPRPAHAYVELVGAMPGQGVTSMFAFGRAAGIVEGVLGALGIPFTLVPPQTWKSTLRVPAGKDGARARASQLMPKAAKHWLRAKDDGRAEAAMIGLYGAGQGRAMGIDW